MSFCIGYLFSDCPNVVVDFSRVTIASDSGTMPFSSHRGKRGKKKFLFIFSVKKENFSLSNHKLNFSQANRTLKIVCSLLRTNGEQNAV